MSKLAVLLTLLIATGAATPSLAYYYRHYHRHPWGGGCVAGACWGWGPHGGYGGWGPWGGGRYYGRGYGGWGYGPWGWRRYYY
jgi:hypothetical protein